MRSVGGAADGQHDGVFGLCELGSCRCSAWSLVLFDQNRDAYEEFRGTRSCAAHIITWRDGAESHDHCSSLGRDRQLALWAAQDT